MPPLKYPRPEGRRKYQTIDKHRAQAVNEWSKWKNVPTERLTFDAADYGNHTASTGKDAWEDDDGNLWGFLHTLPIIGTEKEQFGFFPRTTNASDEWHGYPIIPFTKDGRNISPKLISRWINEELIEAEDIEDLKDGRRI